MALNIFDGATDGSGNPVSQEQVQTPVQTPVVQQPAQQPVQQVAKPEIDIFEDIDLFANEFDPDQFKNFALDENEPAMQMMRGNADGTEPAPQQVAAPQAPADNDTNRYQYWQSQADKERNSREQAERELAELRALSPYAQIIKERPEVLANLTQAQGEQQQVLTPPKPPQKPYDYNLADASNDPESSSYKYRESLDEFQFKQAEYLNTQMDAINREREDSMNRQRQTYEQQQAMNQWKTTLTGKYQFTPQEAGLFVEQMYSPDSLSEQNLVKLFMLNNPQIIQSRKGTRQVPANPVQQRMQTAAPSIVGSSGAAPAQMNEQEAFNAGLVGSQRRSDY